MMELTHSWGGSPVGEYSDKITAFRDHRSGLPILGVQLYSHITNLDVTRIRCRHPDVFKAGIASKIARVFLFLHVYPKGARVC